MAKELKNIELIHGKCGVCRGPIAKEWAGENPGLGTVCESCTRAHRNDDLFGLENVDIVVQTSLHYNPVLGIYKYNFDWRGTRVMINGQIGIVQDACCGSCTVKFPDDQSSFGTHIKTLDWWRLKDLYGKQGGEIEPPPLPFEHHTPTKAPLLQEPILSVTVHTDGNRIDQVQVGSKSVGGGLLGTRREIPHLHMLHAFCNMFVRYKFGLAPNYCCEGGFEGHNFEVRNAGAFTGGTGLSVRMHPLSREFRSVLTAEEFDNLCTLSYLKDRLYHHEQSRSTVVLQDVDAGTVIAVWVHVMKTLLRYDWTEFDLSSVEEAWKFYCRLQDVLLNIMPADEIAKALEYCARRKMNHYGSAY